MVGWVVGTPETEEAQNRLIAVGNNAVVVSVDYRRYAIAAEETQPWKLITQQGTRVSLPIRRQRLL